MNRPTLSSNTVLGSIFAAMLLAGCGSSSDDAVVIDGPTVTVDEVVQTNADIAFAVYSDSLTTAVDMQTALQALVDTPSQATFDAAQEAWLAAREPYGQSEVYRFRVGPIDALLEDGTLGEEGDGPEGQINAWPLAEALIDYVAPLVDGSESPEALDSVAGINGNIIEDTTNFPEINVQVLLDNNELGGDEANVASGYHAIEFLLWGQDLNADGTGSGARDASGGQRPYTDYETDDAACTSGTIEVGGTGLNPDATICQRRGEYLLAAADLLISDLQSLVDAWDPAGDGNHYDNFVAGGETSLSLILEGMGRLSFGELAGERMNIALLTNSQEDEHSCFADNTHRDIFLNALGVQNSFLGEYTMVDGTQVSGAGIDDLLNSEGETDLSAQLEAALAATQTAVGVIDATAVAGTPFDNQIQDLTSDDAQAVAAAIQSLMDQTDVIEEAIVALGVTTGDLRQDTEEFN